MEKSSPFGKIIGYLLVLAVGFGGGYLAFHKAPAATGQSATTTRKILRNLSSDDDANNHVISDSLAKILIAEYGVENSKSPRPLVNENGQDLRGFFITRGPLVKILQDTTIAGISFYLGVDSAAHAKHKKEAMYSLIYIGGQLNPLYTNGGKQPRYRNVGAGGDSTVYDYTGICPIDCGTLLGKADSAYLHHHHK